MPAGQAKKKVTVPASQKSASPALTVADEIYRPLMFTMHQPLTARACTLYSGPDTASAPVTGLPVLAPLVCYGTRQVEKHDTLRLPGRANSVRWSLRQYFYVKQGSRKGFLRYEDVLPITLSDTVRNVRYAIGHRLKPDHNSYQMQLIKTDMAGKRLLATANVDEQLDVNFAMRLLTLPRLSGVPLIVKIINTDNYDGGSDRALLYADAGTHFTMLPRDVTVFDDGGGVDASQLFIPMMAADNTYLLQHDTVGQKDSHADTLTIPAVLPYAPNQIIALQNTVGEYALNNKGDYIKTQDGYFKMRSPIITTTRFYHWDGRRISLLPYKRVVKAKPERWKE